MTMNPQRPVGYCDCGDHAFVAITGGFVTIVSPSDAAQLRHAWQGTPASRSGYVTVTRVKGMGDGSRKRVIQQMRTHSRDWGSRSGAAGFRYAFTPVERQGRVHPHLAGACNGFLPRCSTLPVNWPGRLRPCGLPAFFHSPHAAHEGHIGALSFRLRSLYDGGGYGRLLTSEKLAIDNLSAPEQAGEPTPTPITTSENTKAGRAE